MLKIYRVELHNRPGLLDLVMYSASPYLLARLCAALGVKKTVAISIHNVNQKENVA